MSEATSVEIVLGYDQPRNIVEGDVFILSIFVEIIEE